MVHSVDVVWKEHVLNVGLQSKLKPALSCTLLTNSSTGYDVLICLNVTAMMVFLPSHFALLSQQFPE